MHATADQPGSDLRTTLVRAHDQADQLLADPEGNRLEVVAWLSAHLAAFEHAIYPIVKRRVAEGSVLVENDRAIVTPLARTLRMLERRHSGDTLAGGLSSERLSSRLVTLVQEHRDVQAKIVSALEAALDGAELSSVARSYEDALAHAPTRPHPYLHSGLMFRLDALRDRILDTMDGRHVPLPRVRRPKITPGRWGSYLLGQPHEQPDEEREPRASA